MNSAELFLAAHGDPLPTPILADGTVVDGWRVTAFLGRGGSGEVYRVAANLGRDGSPSRPPQSLTHGRDALLRVRKPPR